MPSLELLHEQVMELSKDKTASGSLKRRQSKKNLSKKLVRRNTLKVQKKEQKQMRQSIQLLSKGDQFMDKLSQNLENIRAKQFQFELNIQEIIALIWALANSKTEVVKEESRFDERNHTSNSRLDKEKSQRGINLKFKESSKESVSNKSPKLTSIK